MVKKIVFSGLLTCISLWGLTACCNRSHQSLIEPAQACERVDVQNPSDNTCDMNMNYKTYGNPENTALVLIFGFSMSIDDWVDFGYIDRLKDDFFILAIEPFGHGHSDVFYKPEDYSLERMSAAIKALMDDQNIERSVLWGYSLGAKILLHFAGVNPERVSGLVLGGFEMHSEVSLSDDLVLNTLDSGGQKWLELWQTMFTVPDSLAVRLSAVDTKGLQALRRAEATWPDLRFAPRKLNAECILYAGEYCFFRDQTEEMGNLFSDSVFMEIPSQNHFGLMATPDSICQRVVDIFARP